MRVIDKQMVEAIKARKDFKRGNTQVVMADNHIAVFLFGNRIANVYDGFMTLTLAGWLTPTTRDRLNALAREFGGGEAPFFQQRGQQWYGQREIGATEWIEVRFPDRRPAMDNYRAVALAEGFEEGSEDEVIAAWQFLHTSGLAYRLQGWFGRQARAMLSQGVIS